MDTKISIENITETFSDKCKRVNKYYRDRTKYITSESIKNELIAGTEAFAFINKIFYKLDKGIQSGITGVINIFNTTNIYIEDLGSYVTKTPNIRNAYKLQKTLIDVMNNGGEFYKVSNKKAPVLLGLQITLPQLLNLLENNLPSITNLETYMKEFEKVLDKILDSKKDMIDINIDKNAIKDITKDTDKINRDLETVTSKKILNDRRPVNKLVKSYKELLNTTKDSLKIGSKFTMERLENFSKMNDTLVLKLNTIYDSFKANDASMNKEDLKLFINYINSIAKMLTSVTFLFYLYYQLLNMLTVIIKMADNVSEDTSVIGVLSMNIKKASNGLSNYISQLIN